MIRCQRLLYSLISLVMSCGIGSAPSSLANTTPDTALSSVRANSPRTPLTYFPLIPSRRILKHKPCSPTVYQIDQMPLGGRQPLLLVHGFRAEYRRECRWDRVITRLGRDPLFNKTYKIYLIRYDSTAELLQTVPKFTEAILNLYRDVDEIPITVLAMSMGGNLVYTAMQNPQVDSAVHMLFSMAAPYHGSPLFCGNWLQYSLYKNLSYPLTRIDHSLSYRMYCHRNSNLLSSINWDNCDGFMPNVGRFHSHLPFGPAGDLTVDNDANTVLAQLNCASSVKKSKLITYGGYMINPYLTPSLRKHVESTVLLPYTFITMKVPAHFAREHAVLKMLNREISRIIPAENSPHVQNWPHLYGLNDGIAPINSEICLPPEICRLKPLAQESDIAQIKMDVDVRLARVFRNADHLTFLDGRLLERGSRTVRDELNPDLPGHPMLDWILIDLLQISGVNPDTIAGQAEATQELVRIQEKNKTAKD